MTETIIEEGDVSKEENADVDDDSQEVIESEVSAREKRILKNDNMSTQKRQITAKVVGIIKRNWRTYTLPPQNLFIIDVPEN